MRGQTRSKNRTCWLQRTSVSTEGQHEVALGHLTFRMSDTQVDGKTQGRVNCAEKQLSNMPVSQKLIL